jgi:hypothetical protein
MIDPQDIQELFDYEPFEPFRIHVSDGKSYDVTNPALVVPMDTKLFIALAKDRWKFLSYFNITSIEDKARGGRRAGARGR